MFVMNSLYFLIQICDDTNQARGFSVIGTGSGLGRIVVSIHVYTTTPYYTSISADHVTFSQSDPVHLVT